MSRLRRIVLVRHGETVGNSSVRFHGSGDVALSDEGRSHMREVARELWAVYDLRTVRIPTRRPVRRRQLGCRVYTREAVKWEAVARSVAASRAVPRAGGAIGPPGSAAVGVARRTPHVDSPACR